MSSFFTVPARQRKRKLVDGASNGVAKKRNLANGVPRSLKGQSRSKRDESISGSESEEDEERERTDEGEDDARSLDSGYEGETAAERRLRLAERYLENIRQEVDEIGFDAEQIDKDLIAERLREDVAETKGRLYRFISSDFAFESASHTQFRSDTLPTTSIAVCPPYVYTVSKDITLIKWEIPAPPLALTSSDSRSSAETDLNHAKPIRKPPPPRRRPKQVAFVRGKKQAKGSEYVGHTDQILTVAASQDGKFVATGGRDRRLIVWDAAGLTPLKMFSQHRDAITSLAFRRGTNELYSGSKDRTIKLWSLNELAYVETLFGHQDEVVDIAALAQERCVSVGARDRTARLWKVVDETQLVFRGGGSGAKGYANQPSYSEGSMDRIALIDEDTFVTGSDNGSISLWNQHKKKAVFTIPSAHGLDTVLPPDEASADDNTAIDRPPRVPQPRWITALTTIPYSDLVFSGSWDGHVRVWRVASDKKRLEPVGIAGATPVKGIINDIAVFERSPSVVPSHRTEPKQAPQDDALPPTEARGAAAAAAVATNLRRSLCLLVATATEHRFGRWKKVPGRNGAVIIEVPTAAAAATTLTATAAATGTTTGAGGGDSPRGADAGDGADNGS